jgi:hypothetical protein
MTYAWEFAADNHLLKLQRLQNKVLRNIENFQMRTPVRDLHMALKLIYIYIYIYIYIRLYNKIMQATSRSHKKS